MQDLVLLLLPKFLLFTIFILSTVFLKSCHGVGGGVYCPLKWSPGGFGSIPPSAVFVTPESPPTPETSEVLVRVFHNSFWRFGRLSRLEGLACIGSSGSGGIGGGEEGTELKFSTYEVLTNPHGCVLSWTKHEGGFVPPFSVSASDVEKPAPDISIRDPIYYAGRVQFNFSQIFLAGNIVPLREAIFVGYQGKEIVSSEYEALESTYPRLSCELTDFTFDIGPPDFGALEETFTGFELIGQDEIHNSIDTDLTQTIRHSKGFHETLILTEDEGRDWAEIEHLDMRLSLWFGSEDIQATIDIGSEGTKTIRVNRNHDVALQKDVRVGGNKFVQVCSVAAILKNPVIPFRAVGTFFAQGLKASHVAAVVGSTGRRILDQDGSRVVAEVRGKLSGRLFLRSLSFVAEKDARASCLSSVPKWATTY